MVSLQKTETVATPETVTMVSLVHPSRVQGGKPAAKAETKATAPTAKAPKGANKGKNNTAKGTDAKAQTKGGQPANKADAKTDSKAPSQTVPEAVAAVFYRARNAPRSPGVLMYSYTEALFRALGFYSKPVAAKTVAGFYESRSIVSNHTAAGRFRQLADGMIELTATGKSYFLNRTNGGSPQRIDSELTEAMLAGMTTGKPGKAAIDRGFKNWDKI